MITVTALSGPHAGKAREVPGNIEPLDLLVGFAKNDWRWEIDFTLASEREILAWGIADLSARVLAALTHGRSAWFQGVEYRAEEPEDVARIAGQIEDAVAHSGFMVQVKSDDEDGVCIVAGATEHPLQ